MTDADLTTETWTPVIGYEGRYEVSDLGRFMSLQKYHRKTRRLLIPQRQHQGYQLIGLSMNGVQRPFAVHRLVYASFHGPITKGLEVNHINAIKSDNRLCNLELLTRLQNVAHAKRLGLLDGKMIGEEAWQAKVTAADVVAIRRDYIPRVMTQEMLAKKYGIGRTSIEDIIHRRTWRHIP